MEKVEELTQTLGHLQRIVSNYPTEMDSERVKRLEVIQRSVVLHFMETISAVNY